MDKSYIFLKSPIGSGGEANIYTVRIRPELVAKVYHQPHGDYARKLAFMVANPPVDPLASSGRVSIAWATELVTDLGLVVGFLMPKLDTSKAKPIFQYYNPSERRKESPTFSYVSLMRTARNLARAVRSVHSRGYVIGDVNESNVLVAEDAIVTLVDTDSFQVNDGTTVYRCTVGKPEYTPPELQGMSFRDVDRSVEHDLFGLGVLIYQLLMEGTHPFGGVFTGQGEAPELQDRIKSGHFPHGRRRVPYKPMPLAPSFQMLPVALQELFLLCFEVGHGNPAARPTADVWSKALGEAEDGLVTCGVNGQHSYSGHLGVCPWCERAAKLGGRDPFPALGAIRSGQHLKPAAIGKAIPPTKSTTTIAPPKLKSTRVNISKSTLVPSLKVVSNSSITSTSSITSSLSNNTSSRTPPLIPNQTTPATYVAQSQIITKLFIFNNLWVKIASLCVVVVLIGGIVLWNFKSSLFPQLFVFYGKTAEALFDEGNSKGISKESITYYSEAIRIKPYFAEAYVSRGLVKYRLRDKKADFSYDNWEAISDFSEAIRINPNFAEAYFNRGLAKESWNLRDIHGAISDYSEAIRINPNFAKAYFNRGTAKFNLRDYSEAILDYNKAIQINPDYAKAYFGRGNAKYRLSLVVSFPGGEDKPEVILGYNEAILDYDKAIRINPNFAEAYSNRSMTRHRLDDSQGAKEDYDKALSINPKLRVSIYDIIRVVKDELEDK